MYEKATTAKAKRGRTHAVGFNFNWDRLCTSMARFQKAAVKSKPKKKAGIETVSSVSNRCDVLVASADRELLHSTGLEIIQELWANHISAELAIDKAVHADDLIFNPANESRDSYAWIIYLKQDNFLKARNIARKEETDMRNSELFAWLRSEIRGKHRLEGRTQAPRSNRLGSQHDSGGAASDEPDVQVITAASRGKKFNRKTVIEEGEFPTRET